MVKTPITIKLDKSHIDVLKDELGGNTRGVETLIENYLRNKSPDEPNPEQEFVDCLYLPSEKNLKATYIAFLNAYVSNGNFAGTLGAYINKLMGETGYDEATIRKHFRKLAGTGFIKPMLNMMFRPTLRLKIGVDREQFGDTLETYSAFLRCDTDFEDYWNDSDDVTEE